MELVRSELKRQARESMKLASPPFWAVALVYLLATTGVSTAVELLPLGDTGVGFTALFLSILVALYTTVLHFGFHLWSLWTHRRLEPGLGSLMQGFSVTGRVIVMEIQIFLYTMAWTFLLSLLSGIPMGLLMAPLLSSPLLLGVLMGLWAIFLYAATLMIQLRYCMAPFLLADNPDDGASAAVHRSVQMTRGWKWELLKLELSFLGWEAISLLVSGAVLIPFLLPHLPSAIPADPDAIRQLFLSMQQAINAPLPYVLSILVTLPVAVWLLPYRCVTRAGFYDAQLRLQRQDAPAL